MARITVEDCIDKFESRFELVLVASNRARKLHSGENPTVEKDNDKSTVIALREIAGETVSIDSLKENLIEEYQTISPLDEEELSLDYDGSETEIKDEITQDGHQLSEENDVTNISTELETTELETTELETTEVDNTITLKNDEHIDISDETNPKK